MGIVMRTYDTEGDEKQGWGSGFSAEHSKGQLFPLHTHNSPNSTTCTTLINNIFLCHNNSIINISWYIFILITQWLIVNEFSTFPKASAQKSPFKSKQHVEQRSWGGNSTQPHTGCWFHNLWFLGPVKKEKFKKKGLKFYFPLSLLSEWKLFNHEWNLFLLDCICPALFFMYMCHYYIV